MSSMAFGLAEGMYSLLEITCGMELEPVIRDGTERYQSRGSTSRHVVVGRVVKKGKHCAISL